MSAIRCKWIAWFTLIGPHEPTAILAVLEVRQDAYAASESILAHPSMKWSSRIVPVEVPRRIDENKKCRDEGCDSDPNCDFADLRPHDSYAAR